MEIIDIFIEDNTLKIKLSDNSEKDEKLLERFEIGIWDYHKKSYQFEYDKDGVLNFNLSDLSKHIRTNQTIVFDIKNNNGFIKTNLEPKIIESKTKSIQTPFGKLKCEFYKNASSGISIKITLSAIKFNISFKQETKNYLIFTVSNSSAKYYLARKNKLYSNSNNAQIPLKMEENNLFINKKTFVNSMIESEETWSIVSINNEQVFKLNMIGNINLLTKESFVDIKITTNKNELIINTAKNYDDSYDRIKVCVIGSCFTRLTFRSVDFYNKDYKSIYEIPLTCFHMSIPSIVSKQIQYNPKDLVGLKQKDLNAYGKDNFEKNLFERLNQINPDYIIIDNYSSITNNLIETAEGSFIDENYYLKDTPALKNINVKNIYKNTSDEFFEIYKKAVKIFKKKIQSIVPLEKVILVRAEPATRKFENGVFEDWQNSQLIKIRKFLWNKFDNFFISEMTGIKVLDMRNQEKYYSEPSPISEFQSNHLNSIFYKDMLDEINKIILIDKLKNHN